VIPAACKRLDFSSREHSGLFGQALLQIAREASSNPRQASVAVGKLCMTKHNYGGTEMKRLTIPVMAFSLLALGFAQAGHTQVSSGDRPQTVESRGTVRSLPPKDLPTISRGLYASILFLQRMIHPASLAQVSPSSQVPEPHGIPIPWGKP
jgi:hypothetical protein